MLDTKTILASRTVWANLIGLAALVLGLFGFDGSALDHGRRRGSARSVRRGGQLHRLDGVPNPGHEADSELEAFSGGWSRLPSEATFRFVQCGKGMVFSCVWFGWS